MSHLTTIGFESLSVFNQILVASSVVCVLYYTKLFSRYVIVCPLPNFSTVLKIAFSIPINSSAAAYASRCNILLCFLLSFSRNEIPRHKQRSGYLNPVSILKLFGKCRSPGMSWLRQVNINFKRSVLKPRITYIRQKIPNNG